MSVEDYDSSSESDAGRARSRHSLVASRTPFPFLSSGHSSLSSTATSTPIPSRSTSPLPQFYFSHTFSSGTDTEGEPIPLLRSNRNLGWRSTRRSWWSVSRRRRKRIGRIVRLLNKWTGNLVRHPFFPSQPITIVRLIVPVLLSLLTISQGLDSHSAFHLRHIPHSPLDLYPQSRQGTTPVESVLLYSFFVTHLRFSTVPVVALPPQ